MGIWREPWNKWGVACQCMVGRYWVVHKKRRCSRDLPELLAKCQAVGNPVRDEILRKFDNCSKLVVLIGDDTHKSVWVDWVINSFFKKKKVLSGDNTWKRIRGMTLKGSDNATMPSALGGQSTKVMTWIQKSSTSG